MPYTKSEIYYKFLNPNSPKLIIFLHGLACSLNFFYAVATRLSENYGCLLIDIPGAGRSYVPESITIKEIGLMVLLVVEELRLSEKNSVVVSHSYLGLVVNYLAAKHTDEIRISGSVLISPIHPTKSLKVQIEQVIENLRLESDMEQFADIVLASSLGSKCSELKKAFVRELVLGQPPKGYLANCGALASACSHEEEFRGFYSENVAPALVILGQEDEYDEESAEIVAGALKNAKKVQLEGTGRWAAIEDDERVWKEILEFLTEIGF